jgi:hypothetical protein
MQIHLNCCSPPLFLRTDKSRDHLRRLLSAAGILLLCSSISCTNDRSFSQQKADIVQKGVVQVGTLPDGLIDEASGIAPSLLHDDVLWTLNDGGNEANLFAIRSDGTLIAAVPVDGIDNRDWEDLASFERENRSYLLIADVGDNPNRRKTCSLFIVEEPDIYGKNSSARVSRHIQFEYEDGPRDCESVAIDQTDLTILLLTKRDFPPRLYELPLEPSSDHIPLQARFLGEVTSLYRLQESKPSRSRLNQRELQPTAMDIDKKGSAAVILTYKKVYLFLRREGDTWQETFERLPAELELPAIRQAEAICFSGEKRSIFVTSEKSNAPLLKMDWENHR